MTNKCDHQCSGNCRRVGCNCKCGEWHETPEENLNQACVRVLKEMGKETPKIGDDPTAYSSPTAPGAIITTAGTSSPETPTEEWEREFDEKFGWLRHSKCTGAQLYDQTMLKSFIRSLLTSHDAELRRKIEGLAEDHYWDSLESQKDIVLLHLRAVLDLLDKK